MCVIRRFVQVRETKSECTRVRVSSLKDAPCQSSYRARGFDGQQYDLHIILIEDFGYVIRGEVDRFRGTLDTFFT